MVRGITTFLTTPGRGRKLNGAMKPCAGLTSSSRVWTRAFSTSRSFAVYVRNYHPPDPALATSFPASGAGRTVGQLSGIQHRQTWFAAGRWFNTGSMRRKHLMTTTHELAIQTERRSRRRWADDVVGQHCTPDQRPMDDRQSRIRFGSTRRSVSRSWGGQWLSFDVSANAPRANWVVRVSRTSRQTARSPR